MPQLAHNPETGEVFMQTGSGWQKVDPRQLAG